MVGDRQIELGALVLQGRISRRRLLRRSARLGLGAPVLASLLGACGGGDADPTATTGTSSGAASPTTSGATATTRSGTTSSGSPATVTTPPGSPVGSPAVISRRTPEIISAITADPRSFDPGFTQGVAGREVTRLFYDSLINIDEQGNIAPGLAESWDRPDGTTYVLNLRQGVTFHDGTPFDAEAVKAHFDYHLDPNNQSLRRGEISSIDTVTAVDGRTVRITLKQPFAAFLAPLFDLTGFIESPTARESSGEDFGSKPVGTGPYRLVEYQKDVHTVVERNPDYWQPDFPKNDRVILRPIPVDTTRLAEVRTGGVHIASDPPFQDLERLADSRDVVLSTKEGFRWDYMAFNQSTELGGNKEFRQAFQWAIDREALQKVVYFDTGSIAYDPFLPGTPFADPSYSPFTRDVARAQTLIESSGVSTPVEIEIALAQDPVKQRVAQIVQQNLAEIGVNLRIQQMDAATLTARIEAGEYEFNPVWGWFGYRPDVDQYLYILTHSKGSRNIGRYNNPDVDRLLEEQRAALNDSERRTLFRQIAQILNDDAVYISYHYGADFKVLSPKLQGFIHRQDGIIRYQELMLG